MGWWSDHGVGTHSEDRWLRVVRRGGWWWGSGEPPPRGNAGTISSYPCRFLLQKLSTISTLRRLIGTPGNILHRSGIPSPIPRQPGMMGCRDSARLDLVRLSTVPVAGPVVSQSLLGRTKFFGTSSRHPKASSWCPPAQSGAVIETVCNRHPSPIGCNSVRESLPVLVEETDAREHGQLHSVSCWPRKSKITRSNGACLD